MPELPEVEVVRLSLEPRLLGRRFTAVDVRSPALREPLDAGALGSLAGATVHRLRRRGKYLLIDCIAKEDCVAQEDGDPTEDCATEDGDPTEDGQRSLVVHLGMSGQLTVVPSTTPVAKHEHVAWHLEAQHLEAQHREARGTGERLRLVDPRRFGQAFVLPTAAIDTDRHFEHLGIEPLGTELDGEYLRRRAMGRRGPIKNFLMDGRVVVGVGNIYACEVLWRCRVHPRRSVHRIGVDTWQRLADQVRAVLGDAIAEGGTTLNDFLDGEGNSGYFQVSLDAYGRDGKPCRRCGRNLRRIVQAGRGTFYCPGCQR